MFCFCLLHSGKVNKFTKLLKINMKKIIINNPLGTAPVVTRNMLSIKLLKTFSKNTTQTE